MFDIALSVSACVRSGTRADVVWMVSPAVSDEAIAFTPGGGRIGRLAGGAFDGVLADVAARQLATGRLVEHVVTDLESGMSGLPAGSQARFIVIPADRLPGEVWARLLNREVVALVVTLEGDEVVGASLATADDAVGPLRDLLVAASPIAEFSESSVTTVLAPVPRLVVAGQSPLAQALVDQGRLLGLKVLSESRPDLVAGIAATLSPIDSIVVMGHDVEVSGRCLLAALESEAGYIGALGSAAMQRARADWLAFQDVTDLSRIHGPAGLDIGARTPAEIAVSIAAEMVRLRSD